MKAAVAASQSRVGALESWQKRIFDEEVVPQFGRFVRNLEAASSVAPGAPAADIDASGIRDYLKFHEKRVTNGAKPPSFVALLSVAKSCAECTAAAAKLKPLMATRLARRGYVIAWAEGLELPSGDVRSGSTSGPLAGLAESSQGRASAGAWRVDLKLVPAEELDAGHADERILRVTSRMAVFRPGRGSYSSLLKPLLQHEGRAELRENESLEAALGGMIADSFSEFGTQLDTALAASGARTADAVDLDKPERLIIAKGYRGFEEFQRLKVALERKLGGETQLRTLTRGRAEFALIDSRPEAEIRRSLPGVTEGENLEEIQLEFKP